MKAAFAALLLALAIGQAAATCAQVKGVSSTMGSSGCGEAFDESGRAKDVHLRRLTVWYEDGCVVGIKTEFAGKGGDKSNMHGRAKGESKSMGMGWDEFVKDVDVKHGKCIEGAKFTTTTGQSMSVGAAGSYVSKVLSEAYVFGFKGTAGNCGISSLALIWAVEDCGQKTEAVAKPAEVPTPVPVPTPKPVPTPVDVPTPVPVPTPKPVPTPVDVPNPVPVPTPKPVPTPVEVPNPVPVPTPVDKPTPVPVPNPVPVPTPVDTPTPVPVPRPVPVPTPVDVPTPVPVPNRVPVPTPVQAQHAKTITFTKGHHMWGRKFL